MSNLIYDVLYYQERYQDLLADAAEERLAKLTLSSTTPQPSLWQKITSYLRRSTEE